MKTKGRVRLTEDQIRGALIERGLIETERSIEGFTFTFFGEPGAAVAFCRSTYGMEAKRFHVDNQTYTLSD